MAFLCIQASTAERALAACEIVGNQLFCGPDDLPQRIANQPYNVLNVGIDSPTLSHSFTGDVEATGVGARPGLIGLERFGNDDLADPLTVTDVCSAENHADPGNPYCVITPGSCSVRAGADVPPGVSCIQVGVLPGVSGREGPGITVNVDTNGFMIRNLTNARQGYGVLGWSEGRTGASGNSPGEDGGNGSDGGDVVVTVNGTVWTEGGQTTGDVDCGSAPAPDGCFSFGIGAVSRGANGGNGGPLGGDAGAGGNGGDATAIFESGSILTGAAGAAPYSVGLMALSVGGRSGEANGGVIVSPGNSNVAGRAGLATAIAGAGTEIFTGSHYGHGILVQSLGGGGGGSTGGFSFTGQTADAGAGGDGNLAYVSSQASIQTHGDFAQGILAQSIGGLGGDAGSVVGLLTIGASGGVGGFGGVVVVTNSGSIETHGLGSNAIEAQSIGGGGGNGSSSTGLVSLGGSGAGAADAGDVYVTNSGQLTTHNSLSSGILAQSIGGGGGNGGSATGQFGGGGGGADGGDAGSVTVINSGSIETGGGTSSTGATGYIASHGIMAQSIGGGGGNGGGAVAVGTLFTAAFGGTGGAGGDARNVNILLDNKNAADATAYSIVTHGQASHGVLAQSIGGGGGNGGFSGTAGTGAISFTLGVGGDGGTGGNSGNVTVQTKGTIDTWGDNSIGILAQSIGGGGGSGGIAVSSNVSGAGGSVTLGGKGGGGGSAEDPVTNLGATVTVSSYSDIATRGQNSNAIKAQSIGGGGGNGGMVWTFSATLMSAYENAIGGTGGTGGNAGAVTVNQAGFVYTEGANSDAIVAQSIGGGGGSGGSVSSTSLAVVQAVKSTLGGTGEGGGDGARVIVNVTSGANAVAVSGHGGGWNIATAGDNSNGILAQSIGGGGGNGGNVASYDFSAIAFGGLNTTTGGTGAGGGNSAQVTVKNGDAATGNVSNIITQGINSAGIKAQSIGGGGGSGGDALAVSGALLGNFSRATGGSGAGGGTGDTAEVINHGNITTLGDFSSGIVAQSIGGGGGDGGSATTGVVSVLAGGGLSIGGSGGDGNTACKTGVDCKASIDSTGNITTRGAQSYGLLAQSIGGGGGSGGFAVSGVMALGLGAGVALGGSGGSGSDAGLAEVINHGNILTSGDGAAGIVAQSLGGGGGNGGWAASGVLAIGAAVGVGVGGTGAGGGDAGSVSVKSTGNITTLSPSPDEPDLEPDQLAVTRGGAEGIRAQAIGGGGGNGGFSGAIALGAGVGVSVSVGGKGGGGGDGGTVNVESSGIILTGGRRQVAGKSTPNVTSDDEYVEDGVSSHGILAQSIGGGGGNGGFAFGIAGSLTAAVNLNFGGSGGEGGDGKAVTVKSTGFIGTRGDQSHGIFAQSIGGGGGNGGFTAGGALTLSAGVAVSLGKGGEGAGGGNAGDVTVTSIVGALDTSCGSVIATVSICTQGQGSSGIFAQSVGGGGGNGGFSANLAAASTGGALSVSLGGSAGGGGDAGKVAVSSINNIVTLGDQGAGIMAQSIGGGGGNGGMALGLSATGTGISGSLSMGGSGGDGGVSKAVTVSSIGVIITEGASAHGILAQSIGGGGGNGGLAASGALTMTGVALGVNLGGSGGGGGDADTVTVKAFAKGVLGDPAANPGTVSIWTKGASAAGIMAQSIGGGGGNGGFAAGLGAAGSGAALNANVGGSGGAARDAKTVTVVAAHNIKTEGDFAYGIIAQSLGGGGGNGGFAVGVGATTSGIAANASVGGSGATGGSAGNVKVTNVGTISTGVYIPDDPATDDDDPETTEDDEEFVGGHNAIGILAQSIGGGGGNGGFAVSGALAGEGIGASVGIGGSGAGGGLAGAVIVQAYASGGLEVVESTDPETGEIVTTAVITNPAALPNGNVSLSTQGHFASGILAQSIGGGGGNGGFAAGLSAVGQGAAIGVNIGGSGGAGKAGGEVTVISYHNIYTRGVQSYGIAAQSIGGGGGNGGFAATLTATTGAFAGGVSVGGGGGIGSEAKSVDVFSVGRIQTDGAQSHAIMAQSIGGGGGNGGFAATGSISLGGSALGASVGGDGNQGGDAGDVTVTAYAGGNAEAPQGAPGVTTTLMTKGSNASGIMAQSIGGSGGNGGFAATLTGAQGASLNASIGGAGGTGGQAGIVTVTSWHNIVTQGDQSNGITAQSIGGGGGNGGFVVGLAGSTGGIAASVGVGGSGSAAGKAEDVTVTSVGRVTTFGNQSNGILAQSIGGGGGNGGFTANAGISLSSSPTASVGVGGSGGAGSTAEDVKIFAYAGGTPSAPQLLTGASIFTEGNQSSAIVAQSIGGGGGNGGFAASLAGSGSGVSLSAAVGGKGGAGSRAGTVDVVSWHNIVTWGDQSHGIVAQSLGGGGGNGGVAVSIAATLGSAISASVGVGGAGGDGSIAKAVTVTSVGTISTGRMTLAPDLVTRIFSGNEAHAIVAQSIGGGGGNGGWTGAGAISLGSAAVGVGVGGSGGTGNDAGTVTVEAYAAGTPDAPALIEGTSLSTAGANAIGILAQSIGGGGGSGGMSVGIAGGSGSAKIGVAVGGSGEGGGNAEAVDVTAWHNIRTLGDFSHGISAQSLGGGGGNGGASISAGLSSSGSVSAAVSVGGSAGKGGNASTVDVTHVGSIATGLLVLDNPATTTKNEAFRSGNGAHGILAQSIGGGGGNGGFAAAAGVNLKGAGVGVGVGGSGEVGGIALAVTVTTSAGPNNSVGQTFSLSTVGDGAHAILAQSIGGGGGNGGWSGTLGAGGGNAAGVSVGGSAGGGNTAGTVDVTSYHHVQTVGDDASAIVAQSIGGGGGNGGQAVALSGSNDKVAVSFSIGGTGGSGGKSDTVTVTSFGQIYTGRTVQVAGADTPGDVTDDEYVFDGDRSNGILAQSIGGGGGNGGLSISGAFPLDDKGAAVSIGGKGDFGGDAAKVTVFAAYGGTEEDPTPLPAGFVSILTKGDESAGILAQSIGGGGGNGGFSGALTLAGDSGAVSVGVGGSGAGGGTGGAVDVTSYHNIQTFGTASYGIAAQSIGGGGGNGGFGGAIAGAQNAKTAISVGIGGTGGGGGTAGEVDVRSVGTITTAGERAHGILAQSIGGGGGTGGIALAGSLLTAQSGGRSVPLNFGLGGKGGTGGNGLDVTVLSYARTDANGRPLLPADGSVSILTEGDLANGILAQSIGGGGGDGGASYGLAGGDGTAAFGMSIGGAAGASSHGATVTVVAAQNILTRGDFSNGISAQSIGGGGGTGGMAVLLLGTNKGMTQGMAIGGGAGKGGNGGDVNVSAIGTIVTGLKADGATEDRGDFSNGILAQSIGGGGGTGGVTYKGTYASDSNSFGASMGGSSGGDGGSAGDVTVIAAANGTIVNDVLTAKAQAPTSNATIYTSGQNASGILAQSIGGGGGAGGDAGGLSAGGNLFSFAGNFGGASGGDGNSGGAVTVTSYHNVLTEGAFSYGVAAQSIGGGGGNGGSIVGVAISKARLTANLGFGGDGGKGGFSSDVSVTSVGWVSTAGQQSSAILSQSIAGGGGNGGFAIGGAIQFEGNAAGIAGSVNVGGTGGDGGNSGDATVVAYAHLDSQGKPELYPDPAIGFSLMTKGIDSSAILAQSIAGGGGNGGMAASVAASGANSAIAVAIGGAGGGAGDAGNVDVTSYHNIRTEGDRSNGISAQAMGGGGGNGGMSLSIAANDAKMPVAAVSVGGSAGGGGDGGVVTVKSIGRIFTGRAIQVAGADTPTDTSDDKYVYEGDSSNGILAQSIGGGGGNGGLSIAGAIALKSGAYSVSVGGSGGDGGASKDVTVRAYAAGTDLSPQQATGTAATIQTLGNNSSGILAQSISGGGGNGGSAIGVSGADAQAAISVAVGASGGDGGACVPNLQTGITCKVSVDAWHNIVTLGQNSHAIAAQSIGGGGGNGGYSVSIAGGNKPELAVGVGVGGGGGLASAGHEVFVRSVGLLSTAGTASNGVLAQSIGGGGGNGGFALTGGIILKEGTGAASVGVGGSGAGGGAGGVVTVNAYARLVDGVPSLRDNGEYSLVTQGNESNGILAQSVGGGGGNGGWSGGLAAGNQAEAAIAVQVGGTGDGGGNGGAVDVNAVHNILTMGEGANGIMAQSLGGGGGNGGFAVALAGVKTGRAPAVGVGGKGEGGGDGGAVTVNAIGRIYTLGHTVFEDDGEGNAVAVLVADRSNGILAQSIGGGGGNGGFSATGAFSYEAGSAGVSVGGEAGGGGVGGDVIVNTAANGTLAKPEQATDTLATIVTRGDNSSGILAQSIGGGGGNGGWAGTLSGAGGEGAVAISVGGRGGDGGEAGAVTVTSQHNIVTAGNFSDGIAAQSISGGGGNGGFAAAISGGKNLKLAASLAVGGGGGDSATAGTVTVNSTGVIATSGVRSNGILAQSIGGGGGNGGLVIDGALAFKSAEGRTAALGVGGTGGGGGHGGLVIVNAYAQTVDGKPQALANGVISLMTTGDDSNGILAQSIGGGGGNGGFAGGLAGGDVKFAGSLQIGGDAGTSSDGKKVTVVSYHNILTKGAGSNGISAQSIGGGGGNGGVRVTLAAVNQGDTHAYALGGGAGAGGDGGIVDVSAIGLIMTEGEQANGILAQSIGGGGGVAGESYKGSGVLKEKKATIAVGSGDGGDGGIGNTVFVTAAAGGTPENPLAPTGTAATIYTKGNMSAGIMAQSIGGGGGNAGMSGSFQYGGGGAQSVGMKLAGQALGGSPDGGTGNFAGAVTVTSYHNIATEGDFSAGILAQSIGGGGGNGGSVIAAGMQDNDKMFLGLAVGGGGGSGGIASAVTVKSVGLLSTEGLQSSAIVAQSIGGSGGNGGWVFTGVLALGEGEENVPKRAAISIGGTGGGAGNSGVVTVDAYAGLTEAGAPTLRGDLASIVTLGNDSSAILAQSIGGGGGNGGWSASVGVGTSKAVLGVAIGGGGGTAGNAEQVKVTSYHNIVTLGARSNGIAAQSLGGGGGNGGVSVAFSGSGNSTAAAVALGGDGAGGGNGAAVTVNAIGGIATSGADSNGILAQSIGGGGGNGGFALTGAISFDGGAGGVSLGGSGGYGGTGQDVTVNAYVAGSIASPQSPQDTVATILTRGVNSNGILAQSIGGGGGNGGWAAGLAGAGDKVAVNVSVGGNAGNGAVSGVVKVDSRHNIVTFGDYSNGIAAQSLAGGGGNGGLAVSVALGKDVKIAAAVAVGGSGGTGADAKAVTVQNVGVIATAGDHSNGILAQSIGGGGGNGGFALDGAINISDDETLSGAAAVGVGGKGAGGGIGLDVTVNAYARLLTNGAPAVQPGIATLITAGDDANGILAQSIGGGGGNGGWSGGLAAGSTKGALAVQLGGSATGGGGGGAVTVTSWHNISTVGARANGIMAQSIGGGGGNGGLTVALSGTSSGAAGSVAVGGGGGGGGDGGIVKVDTIGSISTGRRVQLTGQSTPNDTSDDTYRYEGDNSNGILAQSIGGGGGNGGFALSGAFSYESGGAGGVAVGGSGEKGGVGKAVTVRSYAAGNFDAPGQPANGDATLSTLGANSVGILAQSIGGGGGNGGWAGSLGAAGDNVAFGVSIGGSGGNGGTAGTVIVDSAHNIVTNGAFSYGIAAQSLAGGGGNGGLAVSVAGGVSLNLAASLAIGGSGGTGADAGVVNAKNVGIVATMGDGAHGILAQSIGGGGGSGGFALSGALQISDDSGAQANVGLGGTGDGGGIGSTVRVTAYARVDANSQAALRSDGGVSLLTKGDDADGILAQSIGGGGGNGAWAGGLTAGTSGEGGAASVQLGGAAAAGGAAGAVFVTSYHNIQTEGDRSSGIVAQSLGGGGGNGGLAVALTGTNATLGAAVGIGGKGGAGGDAMKVTVTAVGKAVTLGQQAHAILAQSIGGGGGNGGFAIAGQLAVGADGAAVSVGGKGGSAGIGGDVEVHSYASATDGTPLRAAPAHDQATVYTQGDDSAAIVAQSIGGGGGNGGFAVAAMGGLSAQGNGAAAIAVGVGGAGGGGGSAGIVTVEAFQNIVTKGDRSYGILGQSIGGGGGNGAFAIGAAGGSELAIGVAIGGQGGTAGNGGKVTIDNIGYVTTEGEGAYAIFAQSIGGGGGNGGFAVGGAVSLENAGLGVGLGGKGSGGGTGNEVTVNSNRGATLNDEIWTLVTKGGGAHAIMAQSIGGGGGTGGFSGAGVYTSSAEATIGISMGGDGGTGNNAAKVEVTSNDNILTFGTGANGILAQSIGGGGGDGGFAFAGTVSTAGQQGQSLNLAAALGGSGNTGSDAGKAIVNSSGNIYTFGQSAAGIVAQSIGGGGGSGGLSVAAAVSVCPSACANQVPSISASIGGKGKAGGAGVDVTVTRSGDGVIATGGDYSAGIVAQSIGGGGGNGGVAVAGSLGGGAGRSINAAVGGEGGAGSTAGIVTVTNSGGIVTGTRQTLSVQVAGTGVVMTDTLSSTGRQSHGIFAQSIGGGGGNGGFAFAGGVTYAGSDPLDPWKLDVGVGGSGGEGNKGGAVGVGNSGAITTYGIDAKGIFAQSIGGGGGNGGQAVTGLLTLGEAGGNSAMGLIAAVTVGGKGGKGNLGGDVTVTQSGSIVTFGAGSDAIFAQSVGGGGGTGGNANAISMQLGAQCSGGNCADAGTGSVNLNVVVGGNGGEGGNGGIVKVGNTGSIAVNGAGAVAISAQSVGGGGGSGGNAVLGIEGLVPGLSTAALNLLKSAGTLPVAIGTAPTGGGSIAIGGTGKAAGNGGEVIVTNASQIVTKGEDGIGIEAQSIGGGGGKGGRGGSGIVGTLGIGGSGGASGTGGAVGVTNAAGGNIFTYGRSAHGIFAQSVGGGGGLGGAAGGTLALGGGGGSSGGGGKVTVGNAGQILTEGDSAKGIVAQSIGGGGGAGGAVLMSDASLGGSGGASGLGGEVEVTNSGLIMTKGKDAHGIFAQSVGGGGGLVDLGLGGTGGLALGAVGLAGSGVTGGDGGKVTIDNTGDIQTEGAVSRGIFAQSVGGGGGAGGLAGGLVSLGAGAGASGNGGEVLVKNGGTIVTKGNDSAAIFAQSVGGGGGSAQGSRLAGAGVGAIALGGAGTAAGNGGLVTVENSGDILTEGLASFGIVAQSIGGGGGDGGGALGVGLGGSSGSSGNGGDVKVTNSGIIQLKGDNSIAIFAQSVGGGGGYAVGQAGGDATIASSGNAGNGGNVTVINSGDIVIDGDNSIGILAQSVGGGGGLAIGGTGTSPVPVVVGATGDSGTITVTNNGNIVMNGDNNIAMMIQAIGGSGGVLQDGSGGASLFSAMALSVEEETGGLPFAGASTGGKGVAKTTVYNQVGSLIATGLNSVSVVGQSAAPDGKGNVIINLLNESDTVYSLIKGGSGTGSAIAILDGKDNVANAYAVVTTILDLDGFAVRSTTGNDQINNFTWMTGQLSLGGGTNGFTNKEDALFDAGKILDVGVGGLLKNEGLLSLGKLNRVFASELSGNFEQTGDGTFALDFDLDGYVNDFLHASGTTIAAGAIAINLLNPQEALPGTHRQLVVRSDEGVLSHEGLYVDALPSAIATYSLTYPNSTDIELTVVIDYAPDGDGFTANQTAVGDAIDEIQSAGGTDAFDPIAAALFYQPTAKALGDVYDSLSGEGVAGALAALMEGDDLFINTVLRQADFWRQRTVDGQSAALRTDQLVQFASATPGGFDLAQAAPVNRETEGDGFRTWAGPYGAIYSYDGQDGHGTADLDFNVTGVAGGLEVDFGDDLFAGLAVGASWTDYSMPDRASSGDLTSITGAGYAVKTWGRFYTSGLVGFSYGWGEETRFAAIPQQVQDVPGFSEKLTGDISTASVMGRLEAGVRFDTGPLNVTPYAAAQFDWLRMNGFAEQQDNGDASEIGLQFDDSSNLSFPLSVGVQLDGQWALSDESSLGSWLRLEYVHEFSDRRDAEASFLAAPGHAWDIDAVNGNDAIKFSAGVDLAVGDHLSVFVGGTGELGSTGYSVGGSGGLRLSW